MANLIFNLLYFFGVTWLAATPRCPKCSGEGIRPRKQADGKQLWHCRACCNEWVSSRLAVINGIDE
jgi:transposase-like protein